MIRTHRIAVYGVVSKPVPATGRLAMHPDRGRTQAGTASLVGSRLEFGRSEHAKFVENVSRLLRHGHQEPGAVSIDR